MHDLIARFLPSTRREHPVGMPFIMTLILSLGVSGDHDIRVEQRHADDEHQHRAEVVSNQSAHRGMEELLPIRHKGISGVQPPQSLDMAAREALAEKKARKSDVADAAPPLSSQRPGATTAMDRRDQTLAVSL